MSGPSRGLLFLIYILTLCLRSSLTMGIVETVLPYEDETEIVVNRADIDAADRHFIDAVQKNLTPPENSKMTNTDRFLSALKMKKYRRTQRQNMFRTKHTSRDVSSTENNKSELVFPEVSDNLSSTLSQRDHTVNALPSIDGQQRDPDLNPNQQKKKIVSSPQNGSNKKELPDLDNPLQIIDSSFKHLQPGDVVLSFNIRILNSGTQTLKVMTTHNCCFTMPKLEQEEEDNGHPPDEEEPGNCQSMALIGQRQYTLLANESRNVTLLFASTQLLIYQYQRKGYCEIEFISEGESGAILASSTIYFDTALGRKREKDEKKKEQSRDYISTTHLELKDELYTGRLCEDKKCIPVDCIQEFGGEANRFSTYRGKCMATPYCTPNGTLFYDTQWNKCRKITRLRLDPITDLDEVPEVVRRGKSPLTTSIEHLIPPKDLRTLPHLNCEQLKHVAERTWGRAFLCQNLPIVCQKCSIN